jgi:hypothetical protein
LTTGTGERRELGSWQGALEWLARVRVAGVEPMAAGLGVTTRQVRKYAGKLESEGLAVRRRLGDGGGAVVAITPRGLAEAGHPMSTRSTTNSHVGLLHGRGVSWIAAHCERRGRPWVGPEGLRSDGWVLHLSAATGPGPTTHMPDLGFILNGEERWGVEFERVGKSKSRLRRILEGYRQAELRGDLDAVLYVCASGSIVRLVESVAEQVEVDRAVRTLDWVIAEARARC